MEHSQPAGSRTEITIETITGAWFNRAVSPQTVEIIIDLAGHLYTIAIAGGNRMRSVAFLLRGVIDRDEINFAPRAGGRRRRTGR